MKHILQSLYRASDGNYRIIRVHHDTFARVYRDPNKLLFCIQVLRDHESYSPGFLYILEHILHEEKFPFSQTLDKLAHCLQLTAVDSTHAIPIENIETIILSKPIRTAHMIE